MTDLHGKTLAELKAGLDAGDFTSVELTKSLLGRIEELDGDLNAMISVTADEAMAAAKAEAEALKNQLAAMNAEMAAYERKKQEEQLEARAEAEVDKIRAQTKIEALENELARLRKSAD